MAHATEKNVGKETDIRDSNEVDAAADLRLDRHGLPLIPQPTQHDDDPLVCHPCPHPHSVSLLGPADGSKRIGRPL